MTSITPAGLSDTPSAPLPRAMAVPQNLSAAGVRDAAALARQQLPSAVPAPSALSAMAPQFVPHPTPKPAPKAQSSASALAAQIIAQNPEADSEFLAVFAPPPPPAPAHPEVESFVMPAH